MIIQSDGTIVLLCETLTGNNFALNFYSSDGTFIKTIDTSYAFYNEYYSSIKKQLNSLK